MANFWAGEGASQVKVSGRDGYFVGKTKKTRLTNKILRNRGSEIATESEKVKEIWETFYSPKISGEEGHQDRCVLSVGKGPKYSDDIDVVLKILSVC